MKGRLMAERPQWVQEGWMVTGYQNTEKGAGRGKQCVNLITYDSRGGQEGLEIRLLELAPSATGKASGETRHAGQDSETRVNL